MRVVKPPKKRTIDLRGLTNQERRVGAIVSVARATYRVVAIDGNIARLELESVDAPPGEA